MLPTSLYIHVPWCIKKCPYCDFNSHELTENKTLPEEDYLQALIKDLDQELVFLDRPVTLTSIFIGGGTPSLASAAFYEQLFAALKQRLDFGSTIEVTLEANPGTADQANFAGFFAAGINRLSLGAQSFSNHQLKLLGRIHQVNDIAFAFNKARVAGFKNINIDLMHGLPDQNVEKAMHDLSQAIELQPEHISWYQLTIERNTVFYKLKPQLPSEDVLSDIFNEGLSTLTGAGYHQYEISAFSQVGRQSDHNNNYWLFGDYLGIGAGAHAKLTKKGVVYRRWKSRMPRDYMQQADKLAGVKSISENELPLEFMMNALRLKDGFLPELFIQRTGLELSVLHDKLVNLQKEGLLNLQSSLIKPTARGYLFLNTVLEKLSV